MLICILTKTVSSSNSSRLRLCRHCENMLCSNGKHNVKFGYSLKHNLNTFIAGNLSVGTFTFLGTYTGDGFADFLLGYPDNVQRSYFRNLWGNKANFQSLYVQDDYRVRSNVTVNVGIRY